MLNQYIKLRLKTIYRLCKAIGFFACAVILTLFVTLVLALSRNPPYMTALLYAAVIITLHFSRPDATFLQTYFPTSFKRLYIVDYLTIAVPFIGILLTSKDFPYIGIILLLTFAIPLIPKKQLPFLPPTMPFLSDGSYVYQRAGRLLLPFYAILLLVAAIGAYIGNNNLVIVVNITTAATFGIMLCLKINRQYIFNYVSASHAIKLKCKHAFANTSIIMMPILVCLLLVSPSWLQMGICLSFYINCSMLFLQLEMLRFICPEQDLSALIAYIVLTCLFVLSAMVPIFTFASLSVTVIMAFRAHSSINKMLC